MKLSRTVVTVLAACGGSTAPTSTVGNKAEETVGTPERCERIEGVLVDHGKPRTGAQVVADGGEAPGYEMADSDEWGHFVVAANGRTRLIVSHAGKQAYVEIDPEQCQLGEVHVGLRPLRP